MEQDALFQCHRCKCKKSKDQFKLHLKNTKYAKQGDPICRCLPCAAKDRDRRQTKKRKRDDERSESQVESIPIEQFTEMLRELACGDDLDYRTRVSMQGMTEEGHDIFKLIVKHVWDITGFRFTYGARSAWRTMAKQSHSSFSFRRQITQKNGAVQNMYECCQSESCRSNRPKRRPEEGKQTRDRRRMDRFPCNGRLYLTLWGGHLECVLSHSLKHVHHRDTTIPEARCEFIRDNPSSLVCIYHLPLCYTNLGCIAAFLAFSATSHWHGWDITRE